MNESETRKEEYPMRINKYLAKKNICTRRKADELIEKGKVTINGVPAVLGSKVLETDRVEVAKNSLKENELVYLAYNKPKGVATHSSQKNEKGILDIFKYKEKVYPVGRLDKDSHGLIILSNDGRITDKLLNPDFYHEKEYVVEVDRKINPFFLKHMTEGVKLGDGYNTRKCQVKKMNDNTFSIVLTEGKKRQIRKMCERLERKVLDLKRIRIMNIELGDLRSKECREIKGKELEVFLEKLFQK